MTGADEGSLMRWPPSARLATSTPSCWPPPLPQRSFQESRNLVGLLRKSNSLAVLVLMLVLVPAAAAASPPQPGTAWKKVSAAYTTQAKAHGLTATCTTWNPVLSASCKIARGDTPLGEVLPGYAKAACEFRLTFLSPTFGGNRRATIELCRPRWWTQLESVPGPWSRG